jgi:hypothetical protein
MSRGGRVKHLISRTEGADVIVGPVAVLTRPRSRWFCRPVAATCCLSVCIRVHLVELLLLG